MPPVPERAAVYGLRGLIEAPLLIAIAVVIAIALRTFGGQAFVIPSGSMRPQLIEGDRVVVASMSYEFHDINRGDIIVFEDLEDAPPDRSILPVRVIKDVLEGVGLRQPDHTDFIKRVVALPGEVIEARGGDVYIDGKRLIEPYLPEGVATSSFDPQVIPDGHVFVLGDNRPNSSDSRFVGPIPEDKIIGRALVRMWPPSRWAFL